MQLITKIFLFILSSICLFFLVFFTFISSGVDNTINIDYEYTQTGNYLIQGDYPNYEISINKETNLKNNAIKMRNISLGNNIFFINGSIKEKGENEIHLSEGVYYFDINSVDFKKNIFIEGSIISINGPGDFVVNSQAPSQKSIYSISSKIEVNLYTPAGTPSEGTLLDIYPNMYVMYDPALNKQIINADLLRVQNVQHIDMINSPLHISHKDESGKEFFELHSDIKKYVFLENKDNYNFIKKIFLFNNYQENIYQKKFTTLTQNNFYNFPGEKYIIKYYSYFQNEEKKKVYYKNIILKELITIINSKNSNNNDKIDVIIENLNNLKTKSPEDYQLIIKTINHYYENILFSQHASPALILQFSNLNQRIKGGSLEFKFISLLTLRDIYAKYHNEDTAGFHKLLNTFIDQHKIEMNMSIYDVNHRIHNYFLLFLKNILVADFSKVEDHNDIVLLFQKYIDIKSVFIEKGNDITKKTALFDNAALLKVFVDITKINFFEEKRDDKGLLLPLNPAKITNANYKILYENLNKLLDFHKQYQYFIENSSNRKDKILTLSYNKFTTDLKEYFLALDDYNQYILQYDSAVVNTNFINNQIQGLDTKDAVTYLKQFVGVSSLSTIIKIRDYGYCIQPVEANDVPVKNEKEGYCFKIENLIISGFNFSFILTPSENNTISYLKYTNLEGKEVNMGTNYVMDHIQADMLRKFATSQSREKDKYDFTKFFTNTFIRAEDLNTEPVVKDIIDDVVELTPPDSTGDSLQVRKLKLALLGKNSFLEKIRSLLPISYDYLIVTREDDEYKVTIFPIDFEISIPNGFGTDVYKGTFSGKYYYGSLDADNLFENVSILLKGPETTKTTTYLLNKVSINIDGKFMTKDAHSIISQALQPYLKIENIYSTLYTKYPNETIGITYVLGQKNMKFSVSNGYDYIYNMESQVEIYKNKDKLFSITYNKLKNYLDTLQ